jgi:hypothetical protein
MSRKIFGVTKKILGEGSGARSQVCYAHAMADVKIAAFRLTPSELATLRREARRGKRTLPGYLRSKLGLPELPPARPPRYQCPQCGAIGAGGSGLERALQIYYRHSVPRRIKCLRCGAHGLPLEPAWRFDPARKPSPSSS